MFPEIETGVNTKINNSNILYQALLPVPSIKTAG